MQKNNSSAMRKAALYKVLGKSQLAEQPPYYGRVKKKWELRTYPVPTECKSFPSCGGVVEDGRQ